MSDCAGAPAEPGGERAGDAFAGVLGPASERYFGEGHTQVTRRLEVSEVVRPGDGVVRVIGTAQVALWRRRGVARIEHLGTIDGIVLAFRAAFEALRAGGRASAEQQLAIVRVSVRAGTQANVAVDAIPVVAEWTAAGEDADAETVRVSVGTMRLELQVARGPAGAHGASAPDEPGTGVRATALELTARSAVCEISSSARLREFSVVDCLVVTSQMAQAVLYTAVGVERAGTGNLWMRRCEFTRHLTADEPSPRAELTITRLQELDRRGTRFVNASVRIDAFPGWRGTASLAFEVLAQSGHRPAAQR